MTAAGQDITAPRSALDRLVLGLGTAAAWLFAVAILLSGYEVAMRYLFALPSSWVHPTTTTLCQIGFALGGAWCMTRGEHIRITLIPDRLTGARRRLVELLALGIGTVYLAGLLYAVWLDARAAIWRFNFAGAWTPELTPGPPGWPLPSIGKAALVAGTALFLAVVVERLLRALVRREA